VVCTFLPSVVAVLCTTFFFLLAVPYKKWLIYLELKYDKPVCEFIQDHIPLFSQNLGGPV
jgi:hypothetical protein